METKSRENRYVTASEMADMGKCERLVVLDSIHGKQYSTLTEELRQDGKEEHRRHHVEVQRYAEPGGRYDERCFIATAVYGHGAWQTELLRKWRDDVLLPNPLGRVATRIYYIISPAVIDLMKNKPKIIELTRSILDRFVRWIG